MKRARFASSSVAATIAPPPPSSSSSAPQNSPTASVPCVTTVDAGGSERLLPLARLLEVAAAMSNDDQRHLARSIDRHFPRDVVSWIVTAAALRDLRTRSSSVVGSRRNGVGVDVATVKTSPVDWLALPDSLLVSILGGNRPTENESGYLDVEDLLALERTCRHWHRRVSSTGWSDSSLHRFVCQFWARLTETRLFAFAAPRGMASRLQRLNLSVVGHLHGSGAVTFDRLVRVLPYTPALLYLRAAIDLIVPSEKDGDDGGGDAGSGDVTESDRDSTPATRQRHAFGSWNSNAARLLPDLRGLHLDLLAPVDDDDAPLRPTNALTIAFPKLLGLGMRVARRYVAVRVECPRLRELKLSHDDRQVDDPSVAFSFGSLRFRNVVRNIDIDWDFPLFASGRDIGEQKDDQETNATDSESGDGGDGAGKTSPGGDDKRNVVTIGSAKCAWPKLQRLFATTLDLTSRRHALAPSMPKLVTLELDLAHRHAYCDAPVRVLAEQALATFHRPPGDDEIRDQRSGGSATDGADGNDLRYCCPRLRRIAVVVPRSVRLSGEDTARGGYEWNDPEAALHPPTVRWGAWSWIGSLARCLPSTLATVDLSKSLWTRPLSALAIERAASLERHVRSLLPRHVVTLLLPWHRRHVSDGDDDVGEGDE